ncbi:hypothetical protein [Shewanella pealeana]|uniref:Uncharacterized protein n=1 Tax=Shewanella pealeana (strain ATCC 700345 / ANG-SQ1) TaxID=398579 RepID=A8H0G9_SHEPA|nr:hypothetical protein [Shewanella pealeana]ABV86056.1 hypothetical protein Spea_0729 [Shewanella pealeana ATCC 700345]
MDIKLIVALIGLVGVGASALIQYHLGKKNEHNKKEIEIRANAYLDLVNAVSEIASSIKHDEERNLEQLQRLTQAKSRVVLLGSDAVVTELHKYFTEYGVLNSDESFNAFSNIISAMRNDLSGSNTLTNKLLTESLFGK